MTRQPIEASGQDPQGLDGEATKAVVREAQAHNPMLSQGNEETVEARAYRKKPVVIEAAHLRTREEAGATVGVCTGGPSCKSRAPDGSWPHVHTLEGDHTWTPGDWIITGVKGERYFCKPDIFTETYEPAALAPPIREHGEGVREAIAKAIQQADDAFGYAFNMTALVDGVATHTLTMEGFDPVDFEDREDGYALIAERHNRTRADGILAALSAQPVKDAVRETGWLIEFPESGDSYQNGKRVGPVEPRRYLGGRQMADGRWLQRTTDHNEAIRYVRKIDAERALAFMNDNAMIPDEQAFASEHIWIDGTLSPKSPASVGLDPDTVERCAKVADEHAEAWGLAQSTPAIVIATAIRALTPEDRP